MHTDLLCLALSHAALLGTQRALGELAAVQLP
jgi:ABC-type phosphate transport system permease subunit